MGTQAILDASVMITQTLVSQGWATQGIVTVQGNYTPLASDAVVLVNAAGGPITITLADFTQPPYVAGQRYTVIKTDSSGNAVTVAGTGGQTVAGGTVVLTTASACTSVVADANSVAWYIWAALATISGPPSGPAGGVLSGTYPNPGLAAPLALAATTNTALLTVTNSQSNPGTVPVLITTVGAGDRALGAQVAGDTFTRLRVNGTGQLNWGPGNLTQDTNLYRAAANVLQTDDTFNAAGLQVGGTPIVPPAASVNYKPSNPATTTSAAELMMGIGSTCTYTPTGSGKVIVAITAYVIATGGAANITTDPRFGTGTAPVNGAALTGTAFGNGGSGAAVHIGGSTNILAVAYTDRLSLTANTAYWFDIALATSANTGGIQNISMTIAEQLA